MPIAAGPSRRKPDLRFPADYRLHVHEESATDAHMVLPPKPELNQQQLERIAGGMTTIGKIEW